MQSPPCLLLSDKIDKLRVLYVRFAILILPSLDRLDHKCYIGGHIPDSLDSLRIGQHIFALVAMNVIPVGAGHGGHTADAVELIQGLKGGAVSATAAGDNGCANFHTSCKFDGTSLSSFRKCFPEMIFFCRGRSVGNSLPCLHTSGCRTL